MPLTWHVGHNPRGRPQSLHGAHLFMDLPPKINNAPQSTALLDHNSNFLLNAMPPSCERNPLQGNVTNVRTPCVPWKCPAAHSVKLKMSFEDVRVADGGSG
jgi:hypothetical protein